MEQKLFEQERSRLFLQLLDKEWNGKKTWEHIKDKNLIATPAFKGTLYDKAETKIMFVGRALNGWEYDLKDCSTLESTFLSLMNQTGALETFVYEKGFGEGPHKYRHINSKFFRFIKHILENVGESDKGIDTTWYSDSKQWNQRFIWANLYCIAPRSPEPGSDANPENTLVKAGIDQYVELMKLYIEYYNPDVVVFITDIGGWFVRWKRKISFKDILDTYEECDINNTIVATGTLKKSKIIVCKRPDRRGFSYEIVENMAKTISDNI